ncbi:MAG: YkgJ family cysteine cluster protein [Betaproteobacteria bacterium]|nr:YkgJ family cysteine cluster protein [Betaproteobacteria bacterium]
MKSACLACGACCATFRVSFYWSESHAHPEGSVPTELTVPVSFHHAAMRGTERFPPRCVALAGGIGHSVGCGIHERWPTPCREFTVAAARCNASRRAHGLPPLEAAPAGDAAAA